MTRFPSFPRFVSSARPQPAFNARPPAAVRLALVALLLGAGARPARACTVCGCSLSSDWAAQGFTVTSGFEAGTRFEYFDQTDLRRGTHSFDRATVQFPADEEIQERTLNRSLWFNLDYVAGPRWAFSLQVPEYDRFHTTIAEDDTDLSTSHASGLGDIRLLARRLFRRGLTETWSVQFGLKLPTGRFDQDFSAGPQTGALLDRGLQLGTGTTDFVGGISWFGRPATALGCFAQATLTQPLTERAGFLPSASVAFNTGVRWLNPSSVAPQLQLNVKWETREHGPEADRDNSGSVLAMISPGLTVELGQRASAFAFVQLPVYQRVNGLQLQPHWLLSLGVRRHF